MPIGTPVTIGTGTGSDFEATVTLTTSATVPSGARIIMGCAWSSAVTISGVSGSLSWTVDHMFTNTTSSDYRIALLSAPAPSGLASSTAITVTLTGNAFLRFLSACYVEGLATSDYEDGTSTGGSGSTGATDAWVTAAVTTTNANDLIMGAAFLDFYSVANTPNSPLVDLNDFNHPQTGSFAHSYRIVSSTGSYTVGGTWGGVFPASGPWTGVVVAYKGEVPVADAPEKLRVVQSNLRQA